jgi:hypothetical protein
MPPQFPHLPAWQTEPAPHPVPSACAPQVPPLQVSQGPQPAFPSVQQVVIGRQDIPHGFSPAVHFPSHCLSLGRHSVPHFWKFGLQVKSHSPFVQTALPLPGTRHDLQALPQRLTSSAATQLPLHSFLPIGQPPQTVASAMQAPAQSFFPVGHLPPHFMPSQVGSPSAIIGQAVHEAPQVLGSMFDTQESPQR